MIRPAVKSDDQWQMISDKDENRKSSAVPLR